MNSLYGIPVDVQETVELEVGDIVPRGDGTTWEVSEIVGDFAYLEHDGTRQKIGRDLDLRGEAPQYILRPARPGFRGRDRAVLSESYVDYLKRYWNGETERAPDDRGVRGTLLHWRYQNPDSSNHTEETK